MDTTSLVIPLVFVLTRFLFGNNGTFAAPANANARLMDTIFSNIILSPQDPKPTPKPYSKVSVDDPIEPADEDDEDDDEEPYEAYFGGDGLEAPLYVPNKKDFEAKMRTYAKSKLRAANVDANDAEVLDFLYHSKLALYRGAACGTHRKEIVALVDTSAKMTEAELLGIQKALMLVALGMSAARVTNNNHLSLVTYNNTAKHHFAKVLLNKNSQKNLQSQINAAFENLQPHGVANTGHALRYARERVFTGGNSYLAYDDTRNLTWDTVLGRNLIVLIFTKGISHDSNVLFQEANIIKRNGGRVVMFVSNEANRVECRLITNCPGTEYCYNYMMHDLSKLMENISGIMMRICGSFSRDAVCLEKWSEYGPCSVTCGVGLRDSNFLGFTELLPATDSGYGAKGKSCAVQYANVVKRQIFCTLPPCNQNGGKGGKFAAPVTYKVDVDAPEVLSTEGAPIPGGAQTDAAGHPGQETLDAVGHKANDPDGTQVNVVLQPGVPTEGEVQEELQDLQDAELEAGAGGYDNEVNGVDETLSQGGALKQNAAHLGPTVNNGLDLNDYYRAGPLQDAQDQVLHDEDLLDNDTRRLNRDKDQLRRDAGWVAHDEARIKRDLHRLEHDREHLHEQHHHHQHKKEGGHDGKNKNVLYASVAACLIAAFAVGYFLVYKRRGGNNAEADEENELLNADDDVKPERVDYKVENAESKIWE